MEKQTQLAKICAACNLSKPLSAFLQISGLQGTTYGNICATCRGSSLNKQVIISQNNTDDEGSSSSGLRIDAKTKIFIESEKRQTTQQRKESDKKEDKKRQFLTDKNEERTGLKEEAERKHREEYIEPKKKSSFLNYQHQKLAGRETTNTATEKDPSARQTAAEQPTATEMQRENEFETLKEEKIKNINLNDTYIDPLQAGELKFQSAEFQKIKTWLGTGAAINTYERQFLAKNKSVASTEKPAASQENVQEDPLINYINETWEPTAPKPSGSRRR